MEIQIYGTHYTKKNTFGDFKWMCEQKEFEDSLFIFNDNEEYHNTNGYGIGNAIIRKYNKHNKTLSKPKSAGICTGTLKNKGYKELSEYNKNATYLDIGSAFDGLVRFSRDWHFVSSYSQIIYESYKNLLE